MMLVVIIVGGQSSENKNWVFSLPSNEKEQVLFHRVHHVLLPRFYRGLELTNRAQVPEAFYQAEL